MKMIKLLMVAALTTLLVGCGAKENPPAPPPTVETVETIAINFVILDATEDQEKVLFEGAVEVSADCKTLADVLLAAQEIQAVTEEGAYGLQIMGLLGIEGDWDKGPWWVYESENNQSCQEAGFCDGASTLKIGDGDLFLFKLISSF